MTASIGYGSNGWQAGVSGKAYQANYSKGGGFEFKFEDLGKSIFGASVPEFRNTSGELVIPDLSLKGVSRVPHYKEEVVKGIPVSYFEYPSGYLTGHACQIQCLTPEELKNWTSSLHNTGMFGSAAKARSLCVQELATRVDQLFGN